MRVAFMGTPDFAIPTLERLLESPHQVVVVVTQPDRPKGRGQQLAPSPVKVRALDAGIPVLQPEKLRAERFHETLATFSPDVAVVVAYGKILPPEVLTVPRHGCFNVHASLLPRYRGAAPIQRAMANCDDITGVTIIKLDEGMDTGPIVAAEEVPILEDDDHTSLSQMLSVIGANLLIQTLDALERDGTVALTPQDETQATYAPPLTKEEGAIDWSKTNQEILSLIRAMTPWPGAVTTHKGDDWKILKAQQFTTPEGEAIVLGDEVKPGEVFALVKNRGFAVRTADASVIVTRLQLPNRAPVDAGAFLNSRVLKEGDILGKEEE